MAGGECILGCINGTSRYLIMQFAPRAINFAYTNITTYDAGRA